MPTAKPILGKIRLAGREISYRMRISTRARRMRISIGGEGVEVVLPAGLPPQKGVEMLTEHAGWVVEKLAQMERKAARQQKRTRGQIAPPPEGHIFLRGKPVKVEVRKDLPAGSRARAGLTGDVIVLRLPTGSRASAAVLLAAWLKAIAREELGARVQVRAREMGLRPAKLAVRDQKTRWGSCSHTGTLSFNWRLVMTPPSVLDYVVVHELAHMLEHNHSSRFWAQVARYCPDFQRQRAWLKLNGELLRGKLI